MESADWIWIWVGVAVAFAFLELVTPFLFFMISFAAGAAVAAVVAAVDGSVALQWVTFLLASVAALLVLVPVGRRLAAADGDDVHEGATRQLGRIAVVIEDIPATPHGNGVVRLERQQWPAETDADDGITKGTEVEVIAVRGTRLVVAPTRPRVET